MKALNTQDVENKILRSIFSRFFIPENARDPRIDEAAQRALAKMAGGNRDHRMRALVLTAGVKSGAIAGIRSDGPGDAAPGRGDDAAIAIPEGRDALLSSPIGSKPAPVILFREDLRGDAEGLARALSRSIDGAWRDVGKDATIEPGTEPGAAPRLSCLVYCGLCAIAIADAIPGDEVFACLVCLTCPAGDA